MAKYFLLFSGIMLIIAVIWSFYEINRPRIGPMGEGTIPLHFWITMISTICVAIFAIIVALQLFVKRK